MRRSLRDPVEHRVEIRQLGAPTEKSVEPVLRACGGRVYGRGKTLTGRRARLARRSPRSAARSDCPKTCPAVRRNE